MSSEKNFARAVAVVADPKSADLFPNDAKLKFYALFKQAKDGDLPMDKSRPSILNAVARAKFDAWEELRGTTKAEAQTQYIQLLQKYDNSFVVENNETSSTQIPESNGPIQIETEPDVTDEKEIHMDVHYVIDLMTSNPILTGSIVSLGLGVSGFIFTVLSWTALSFFLIAIVGVTGIIVSFVSYIDENGIISFLPRAVQKFLLESTLLEFLTEDKLFREVKETITRILPAFLAKDDEKMIETLSLMSLDLRKKLTREGLIHIFSKRMQKVLLPRKLREKTLTMPPTYRLPPALGDDKGKLSQVIHGPKSKEEGDLEKSKELFKKMLTDVISQTNTEFILSHVDPQKMKIVIGSLLICLIAQLGVSSESRRIFMSILRSLLLVGSLLGTGVSSILLMLWIAAKQQKKRMGW